MKNHVITILDCINIEYTYSKDIRLPFYKFIFQKVLDNARYIIAISRSTSLALQRHFSVDPSRLLVISGPNNIPLNSIIRVYRDKYRNPFILMVTNSLPHKNTSQACLAISQSKFFFKNKFTLHVVGTLDRKALNICKEKNIPLRLYSNITDDLLRKLYLDAEFLFSPNLDEGLNMPVAECLSCGGNVLCSDIAVHREFYDGKVYFVNLSDIKNIVDSIDRACSFEIDWTKYNSYNVPVRSFSNISDDYLRLFHKLKNEIGGK